MDYPLQPGAPRFSVAEALRLYQNEPLGIRLFVRARRLLTPLERIAAHVPAEGDVLDLGCGHGLFSLALGLADPQRRILGLDPSPAKIEVARRVGQVLPNVTFQLGSIEAAAEQAFGVIAVLDVLYLLPRHDKVALIQGCRRALSPDGVLLVKTNDTHPRWKYAITRLQEWVMTRSGLTLGHGGLHFLSCQANLALLQAAGFAARVVHLPHWTPYPHVLFVARPSARLQAET